MRLRKSELYLKHRLINSLIALSTALTMLAGSLQSTIEWTIPIASAEERINTNEAAEVLLKNMFKDTPVMLAIAKCESQLRQWKDNGEILRGIVNPLDVGLFQINEKYHLEAAKKLGIDIESAEGNIAYAKLLYEKEGTRPWSASKNCWKPLAPN